MKTRFATRTDADAISAFVSALASEHIASSLGDGGLEKLLNSMDTDSTLKRVADGWPHICALDGEDLAGVVVVKPPGHLYHLFVRTDLHRTGIGKKLFAIADDWSLSTSNMRLATVNSSLNAIAVYNRLGFEVAGPIVETAGVRHQPMVRKNTGQ